MNKQAIASIAAASNNAQSLISRAVAIAALTATDHKDFTGPACALVDGDLFIAGIRCEEAKRRAKRLQREKVVGPRDAEQLLQAVEATWKHVRAARRILEAN